MNINGRYSVTTADGHRADECKSAMQKYARRGNWPRMYYAVNQLNGFYHYESSTPVVKATIKAIRTNMINRLSVILFEDVSFRYTAVFERVIELISLWKQTRETDAGSDWLQTACQLLASTPKARQPSYLRNRFGYLKHSASSHEFKAMVAAKRIGPELSWLYANEPLAAAWLKTVVFPSRFQPLVAFALAKYQRLLPSKRASDRLIFLVVPVLWIVHNVTWELPTTVAESEPVPVGLKRFDEFVYDMHTQRGKNKDRQQFVTDGALVTNEDALAVDSDMKRLYLLQLKPHRSILPFTNVRMITDGLCGGKLPCFFARFRGVESVVKPIGAAHNFGLDYAYVDAQKVLFGITSLNLKLVQIPGLCVARTGGGKQFSLGYRLDTNQVFAVMNPIRHTGDLGKQKHLLEDETKFDEMLRVRLFNGLFATSDNILRNILVAETGEFVPIDENDMLGKRSTVFNAFEPIKRHRHWSKERLLKVLAQMNVAAHTESMLSSLETFGLEDLKCRLRHRIENYKTVLLAEL